MSEKEEDCIPDASAIILRYEERKRVSAGSLVNTRSMHDLSHVRLEFWSASIPSPASAFVRGLGFASPDSSLPFTGSPLRDWRCERRPDMHTYGCHMQEQRAALYLKGSLRAFPLVCVDSREPLFTTQVSVAQGSDTAVVPF